MVRPVQSARKMFASRRGAAIGPGEQRRDGGTRLEKLNAGALMARSVTQKNWPIKLGRRRRVGINVGRR